MITTKFQEDELSLLGFGAMRLPEKDGRIDEAQVEKMVAYATEHGVNYFDTAFPYHAGHSEIVMGKVLSAYPRDSYRLATKYPGHQIADSYDPADIFEKQLKKCGVEYFDYYLLHNVNEMSLDVYLDPKWGIVEYFKEQRRLGRIKHLGFSSHGRIPTMERFLDAFGKDMEFCQIQLNFVDWTLQDAKGKVELLKKWNLPVWVMEPVRGGKLANLKEIQAAQLKALRPEESIAAWGFRFLQGIENVQMVLSGMSNMEQMADNVKTFESRKLLTQEETAAIMAIAEDIKNAVPCTSCRYCCDGCPMGLDIPLMMRICSELRVADSVNSAIVLETMEEDKLPSACLHCGLCTQICPQNIPIPDIMEELTQRVARIPKWRDTCRQREEEAKRLQGK